MVKLKSDDGTELFLKVTGQGSPVVLIAGGFCDHHVWDDILDPLSHSYQVITYDNRGIGQSGSSKDDYTVEQLANDLNSLLIALRIPSAHIIGHSMGGFIAQYFAAHYPKKVFSLSLLSSLLVMNPSGHHYLDRVIEDAKNDLNKLHQQMPEIAGQSQTLDSIRQQTTLCKKHDARPYINKINAPTLIMSGLNEPVVTKEETHILAAAIKNVKRTIFLNCGHMLQRELSNEVVKELLDFLGNGEMHSDLV